LKGYGRKRSWHNLADYHVIYLEPQKKKTKLTVWIAGLQTEILTQNSKIRREFLHSTSEISYHLDCEACRLLVGAYSRDKYHKRLQIRMRSIILGSRGGTKGIWRKLNNGKPNYSH
jgi:hypothetical protein